MTRSVCAVMFKTAILCIVLFAVATAVPCPSTGEDHAFVILSVSV